MKKIGIIGLGGVGAFYGGLMASRLVNEGVNVFLITREGHIPQLQSKGLTVKSLDFNIKTFANFVTADEVKDLDVLFIAVKSYQLSDCFADCEKVMNSDTLLIPLQNGVLSAQMVKKRFANNVVLDACVYIMAKKNSLTEVEEWGKQNFLNFGIGKFENSKYVEAAEKGVLLANMLRTADINAFYKEDIESVVWSKFIFISALATITSATDLTTGAIFNSVLKNDLKNLITEVYHLASVKGINLPVDLINETYERMSKLPGQTTTSMQRDMRHGNCSEFEHLTEYVLEEAQQYKLSTPFFAKYCNQLVSKLAAQE